MKERDEIAELFKDQLEHHAESVDPTIWAKVQTGIAGKTIGGAAAASKVGGIIKIIAVSSITIGSFIGVGFWLQSPEKSAVSNAGHESPKQSIGQENPTKTPDVEPFENPIQPTEAKQGNSSDLVTILPEADLVQTKEQLAALPSKENTDAQIKRTESSTNTTIAESAVSNSDKPIDSKIVSHQNSTEPRTTTPEKVFKNLLASDIPNVFTPNGDGKNDLFNIPVAENVNHNTKIFSQKGELVVEFTQVSNGWDGTKTGGSEAANGTYFYVTFVSDQVGNQKQIKGTINLIR